MERGVFIKNDDVEQLMKYLVSLCVDISKGKYAHAKDLFALTKGSKYPESITELAESFGMMIVKVETREYHLEEIIKDLKKTKAELLAAKESLSIENINLKHHLRNKIASSGILGRSKQITDLLKKVEKVAQTPVNVLITGETGTGKELLARAIHYNSERSEKPFVALNCSAIPESVFESEIFGIEKGVATGVEKRMGKIEQANEGTLFFDEIGDMPLSFQSKILRVVEGRQLERVGGRKSISVDVRLVAATNKDLEKAIEDGTFREDLFYRLNVVNLHIPPLRDRKDDIPLLVNFFLEQSARRLNRNKVLFSREAMELLNKYSWPGNVRELENEVERAVALAYSDTIHVDELSESTRKSDSDKTSSRKLLSAKDTEEALIEKTLQDTGGNRSKAARMLGFSREGLRKKMKRYEIQ